MPEGFDRMVQHSDLPHDAGDLVVSGHTSVLQSPWTEPCGVARKVATTGLVVAIGIADFALNPFKRNGPHAPMAHVHV